MVFSELARPWRSDSNSSPRGGLLLSHGFTGTPQSMRPWAEHHAAAGWEVALPLLPGHATTWQELGRTPWTAWTRALAAAVVELSDARGPIAVGGLSMGGALALHLAADPALRGRVGALVLVNPALTLPGSGRFAPLLAPFVGSVAAIASDIAAPGVREEAYERTPVRGVVQLGRLLGAVRARLADVDAPVLLATSARDGVVDRRDSDRIAAGVRGEVERMLLPRSRHVATLDRDAPELFARSAAFLGEHLGSTGS